jgi:hypothetical protein
MILCHPCTPVPDADLEQWLGDKLDEVRQAAADATIRLSHLAQELPDTEIGIGWLIELELSERSTELGRDGFGEAVADLITDLRFLGLQPRVLTAHDPSDRLWDLTGSERSRTDRPLLDYPGLQ